MLSYEQKADLFGSHATMRKTSVRNTMVPGSSRRRHFWIVTGPAGCGKTTVGKYLANEFSLPYVEGDEYHPKTNIEKMAQGIPLNDNDRWDWLIAVRQRALSELGSVDADGVVLTCSALKRKYRDVFRIVRYYDPDIMVHFIYLRADEETLKARVHARQDHYMKAGLVHSQFSSLEEPDCESDACRVDVTGSKDEVKRQVKSLVLQILESRNL